MKNRNSKTERAMNISNISNETLECVEWIWIKHFVRNFLMSCVFEAQD